jgi:hypothetical protein
MLVCNLTMLLPIPLAWLIPHQLPTSSSLSVIARGQHGSYHSLDGAGGQGGGGEGGGPDTPLGPGVGGPTEDLGSWKGDGDEEQGMGGGEKQPLLAPTPGAGGQLMSRRPWPGGGGGPSGGSVLAAEVQSMCLTLHGLEEEEEGEGHEYVEDGRSPGARRNAAKEVAIGQQGVLEADVGTPCTEVATAAAAEGLAGRPGQQQQLGTCAVDGVLVPGMVEGDAQPLTQVSTRSSSCRQPSGNGGPGGVHVPLITVSSVT